VANIRIVKHFSHPFLSQFLLTRQTLPFSDNEIVSLDQKLAEYEQIFLNPDIERYLISKNELLASFAISKAENSQLSLKHLVRFSRGKIARQTLVNYLNKAVEQKVLNKMISGRKTYYSLNFSAPENQTLTKWLDFVYKRLDFIPNNLRIIIDETTVQLRAR